MTINRARARRWRKKAKAARAVRKYQADVALVKASGVPGVYVSEVDYSTITKAAVQKVIDLYGAKLQGMTVTKNEFGQLVATASVCAPVRHDSIVISVDYSEEEKPK